MIGSLVNVITGNELNKEGTHRNRNKGKDGKFMANLIPSHNHQRDIDGIKVKETGIVKANRSVGSEQIKSELALLHRWSIHVLVERRS